jgi:mannose-6-phosphate isomerase
MSSLEYRPWGAYEVLHDTSEAKVKIIEVEPGQRLSYQYHTKRKEQWTVIYGELTVILDDEKVFRKAGESIKIPLGAKHRAWNETDKPVRFIEVQTGTSFGEDDIVRLEDDYMRADITDIVDSENSGLSAEQRLKEIKKIIK